jgi:hypothetical protein
VRCSQHLPDIGNLRMAASRQQQPTGTPGRS